MTLKTDILSFIKVIVFGAFAGGLCAILDIAPYDNIWTFSSFSGSLGFWAFTGMIVLMQSDNWKLAGINTFLYFAVMNTCFFLVYLVLPIEFPRIGNLTEALLSSAHWLLPSLICGIGAMLVHSAKRDNWIGIVFISLPLGLLLCEFLQMLLSVLINHRYLFQTIIDLLGLLVLYLLYKGQKKQVPLIITIVSVALVLLGVEYIRGHTILFY